MSSDVADLGWAAAGMLLAASGVGLHVLVRARASALLFLAAGVLFVVVGLAPDDVSAPAGIAAMALLTAATVTYPRLTRDLATWLALGGALLVTPVLAWQLGRTEGLSSGDVVWIAFALAVIGASHLWWRLESTDAATRSSLLWVLCTASGTIFLIGIVSLAGAPAGLAAVVNAGLGLIGVAAVLGADHRHALDGRWLASRAAAWCFSVGCAFAAATLVFTLVAWRTGTAPGIVSLAVAAVVCGTMWPPLLAVVQRVSDGVLFGFRPDALTAAQRVAVGIGDDPTAAVRAIQEGLVLPYAALALTGADTIEVGTPPEHRRIFPIDLDDEHIGDLVVGVRPGDLGLSRDDERVLTLALPLLVQMMRARSLAASLQQARVASASAREEERLRLRRDLHDGLGPRLTGIAFTADAARLAATREARTPGGTMSRATAPMLDRIRCEAETALDEIRELVYGLRPPALDELGLVGAIVLQADALEGLPVAVEASTFPTLPTVVEVAVYRIVMEALTNIARHSGATRSTVTLRTSGDRVVVSIADDGRGGREWSPGVGLSSMRERASELGGTVAFHTTPSGSTVTAQLPLSTSGPLAPHDHPTSW